MTLRASPLVVVTVLSLTGCGPSPGGGAQSASTRTTPSPPNAPTPTTGSAAPTPGGLPIIHLPGSWTSPTCGTRGYVRNLELLEGGRFRSEDRVSPCPPGVSCVWSGIVNREGTWAQSGTQVTLTVDKNGGGPKVAELPAALEFPGAELIEVQGSERCSYTKK